MLTLTTDTLIVVAVGSAVGGIVLLGVAICLIRCAVVRRRRHRKATTQQTPDGSGYSAIVGDVEDAAAKADAEDTSALMNALFFLRSHTGYELSGPLRNIGSRPDTKHFFLVTAKKSVKPPPPTSSSSSSSSSQ
jgi:hypothetical protein